MLKLQKIDMIGFKSFAEPTEIVLDDGGILAIVGPNGCGKSNISDAVNWVLGEQSARSLRSSRMQDVIFSGTAGRRATGLAEVRLTLLNPEATEFSPLPAGGLEMKAGGNGHSAKTPPATEKPGTLTVARRLFRSGESEYLLNNRSCRLRDIQEIFLGTGLGPDTYAIIEQGRISQILSAKPYELRALLEEAAGVTKFKAKRKLAWAKLESSKQNLARVNDILEEVRRQVNSLQRQAARARRYGELREQLRTQLRILLATRYSHQEQQATALALELGFQNHTIQEHAARLEAQERQQQELSRACEQEEAELRRLLEEHSAARVALERARSQRAAQTQQIAYLSARVEERRQEEAQLEGRLHAFENERNACATALEEVWVRQAQVEKQWEECAGRSRSCQEALRARESRLDQVRYQVLEAVHQCATLHNQLVQAEQFLAATERQIVQADEQRAAAEAAEHSTLTRSEQAQALVRSEQIELETLRDRRRSLADGLQAARAEQQQQRERLEQLRSGLAADRARLASLEEILSRRAYSAETVQRLFERFGNGGKGRRAGSEGAGEHESPRFEPIGVLADFLEVESAHERVVEEFLREELEYVVVEDWSSASEGLRLLRTEVPGRATFLMQAAAVEATGGKQRSLLEGVREGEAGVVGRLENHLRFTNGLPSAAGGLLPKLRQCYLVADREAARALAAKHPEGYFLTSEGDWFHGALVTAGRADHSGPLALKREMRELTRRVAELEKAVTRATESLALATQAVERQQQELEQLVSRQQETEKRLLMAERDRKAAREEQERAAERLALLTLEMERLCREAERARERRAQDAQEIALREQQKAEMESETTGLAQAIAELEAAREQSQARAAELQSQLAALDERQRAAAEALARVERSLEETRNRQEELHRQMEQWDQQRNRYAEDNERLEQEMALAEARLEELALRMAELERAAATHRRQAAELEQSLHQLRQELEELRSRKTELEVQLARAQSELEHLRETCRNELQMEAEALAAEDLPSLDAEQLAAAEENYRHLKAKIENLGPINMMALEEFEESRQRKEFLERQQQDLLDSIRDTTQAIQEIDGVTHRQFGEAFEQINGHFQRTFATLFGGGQGFLRLTEAEDPAEAGIEIVAQPPGKRLQNVLLLSGGEKALAALALLLAIFRYKPSPFCILDEVDAPLDDANIDRFTQMVQEMSRDTQFLLITHSKKTMSIAPTLYGVTMEEPGVSKIVSVKLNGTSPTRENRGALTEVAV